VSPFLEWWTRIYSYAFAFLLGAFVDIQFQDFFDKDVTTLDWVIGVVGFLFFFLVSAWRLK
jgi:hypothetical protein